MKKLILGLIALASSASFAGNGSSGGGNIFGNQLNPWFLGNTKTVNYCIEVSPDFSDLSESRISEVIRQSLNYWKKSFAESSGYSAVHLIGKNAAVATQEFIPQSKCDNTTDLKFQMGFLTDDQKKLIPDYKQLLGIAYRTSYDEVHLRGKGFIYIAPERGPLRPLSKNLHPRPWSFGQNFSLFFTVSHELGHVFGLQDDYYERESFLLSARFVEHISNKSIVELVDAFARAHGPAIYTSVLGCNSKLEGFQSMEYSGGDHDDTLLEIFDYFEISPASNSFEIRSKNGILSFIDMSKNTSELIGSVDLNSGSILSMSVKDVPAVSLYLSNKQKVFSKDELSTRYNQTISLRNINKSITLPSQVMRLKSGKEVPVFITFDGSCYPSIGAVINSKIVFDIWE